MEYVSFLTREGTMVLNDFVTTLAPIIPDMLIGKLTIAANYALNENEVKIFSLALNAISAKLQQDGITKDKLTTVNAIFTKNGSFSMREDNANVYASHFSLAIYQLENLRNTHNERFILFAFVEELVHHYWRIENETEVKYKILEIVQLIDTGITLEMVKGWGVNGL